MNRYRKKYPSDRVPGGLARIMVLRGVGSMFHAGNWFPAADIYETESALIVHMDISGIESRSLAVMVEESRITVSGERGYAPQDTLLCVHQLEIERGYFERSISLPKPVDVSRAVSESSNGFLRITLPLRRDPGIFTIIGNCSGI